jgi:hypothetical protein
MATAVDVAETEDREEVMAVVEEVMAGAEEEGMVAHEVHQQVLLTTSRTSCIKLAMPSRKALVPTDTSR